jgi:hypothetical protein
VSQNTYVFRDVDDTLGSCVNDRAGADDLRDLGRAQRGASMRNTQCIGHARERKRSILRAHTTSIRQSSSKVAGRTTGVNEGLLTRRVGRGLKGGRLRLDYLGGGGLKRDRLENGGLGAQGLKRSRLRIDYLGRRGLKGFRLRNDDLGEQGLKGDRPRSGYLGE